MMTVQATSPENAIIDAIDIINRAAAISEMIYMSGEAIHQYVAEDRGGAIMGAATLINEWLSSAQALLEAHLEKEGQHLHGAKVPGGPGPISDAVNGARES